MLERELSERLGVSWVTPERRVPMREIAGVPTSLIDRFSTRRAAVLATYERLEAEWRAIHGRTPTHAEQAGMMDEATTRSRHRKARGDVDLHEQWRAGVTDGELAALADVDRRGVEISDGGRLPAGSRRVGGAGVHRAARAAGVVDPSPCHRRSGPPDRRSDTGGDRGRDRADHRHVRAARGRRRRRVRRLGRRQVHVDDDPDRRGTGPVQPPPRTGPRSPSTRSGTRCSATTRSPRSTRSPVVAAGWRRSSDRPGPGRRRCCAPSPPPTNRPVAT